MAADECGAATGLNATVICPSGTYTNGITYNNTDGINIRVNDPGINTSGRGIDITTDAASIGDIEINDITIGTITLTNNGRRAFRGRVFGPAGSVDLSIASGSIVTSGRSSTGLRAEIRNAANSDPVSVEMHGGSIQTSGRFARGLIATTNNALGSATARMSGGSILTTGQNANGVFATAGGAGKAEAHFSGGNIETTGTNSRGLIARNDVVGSAEVNMTGGNIDVTGISNHGISSQLTNINAASSADVNMTGGTISVTGLSADGISTLVSVGFGTLTEQPALRSSTIMVGPEAQVTTDSSQARAIRTTLESVTPVATDFTQFDATVLNPESRVSVVIDGTITTLQDGSHGYEAVVSALPLVPPSPNDDQAVSANNQGSVTDIGIAVGSTGHIDTSGESSFGIWVMVDNWWAGYDEGSGANGWGCDNNPLTACAGTGDGNVNIEIAGLVSGGWGVESTLGDGTERLAAGLRIDENQSSEVAITIGASGQLGARSDLAFDLGGIGVADGVDLTEDGDDGFELGPTIVENNGVLVGSGLFGLSRQEVTVSAAVVPTSASSNGDLFINNGKIEFRRWSDIDGMTEPELRDLEAVALFDFDALVSPTSIDVAGALTLNNTLFLGDLKDSADHFINAGTFQLTTVPETDSVDDTKAYLPAFILGTSDHYALQIAGVEQGHIRDLERFTAGGSIVMQDAMTGGQGPVAGDVLVITGNDQIGAAVDDNGAGEGGGPGVFETAGGILYQDAVLNQGGRDHSIADILVVDQVELGERGPVSINVAEAGGQWQSSDLNDNNRFDEGEGILLVDVLDPEQSDPGAFVLASPLIQNEHSYRLVQSETSGDWFLYGGPTPFAPAYLAAPLGLLRASEVPAYAQRQASHYHQSKSTDQNYFLWHRLVFESFSDSLDEATWDTGYDARLFRFDFGLERQVLRDSTGRWHAGLQAHYRNLNGQVSSYFASSSFDSEGFGLGWTATRTGTHGFYADFQQQLIRYKTRFDAQNTQTQNRRQKTYTLSTSAEVGKTIRLSPKIKLIPQIQTIHTRLDSANFTDDFGARVRGDTILALDLRAGTEVVYHLDLLASNAMSVSATADIYYRDDRGIRSNTGGYQARADRENMAGRLGLRLASKNGTGGARWHIEGEARSSLNHPNSSPDLSATFGLGLPF